MPVLGLDQRIVCSARPAMTKITGVAGLEGFLVERCKVPVYSLSVQRVGDSTVLPFHRYSIYYLAGPAVSLFLHPLPLLLFLPDPSSLSVVYLRYWSP